MVATVEAPIWATTTPTPTAEDTTAVEAAVVAAEATAEIALEEEVALIAIAVYDPSINALISAPTSLVFAITAAGISDVYSFAIRPALTKRASPPASQAFLFFSTVTSCCFIRYSIVIVTSFSVYFLIYFFVSFSRIS